MKCLAGNDLGKNKGRKRVEMGCGHTSCIYFCLVRFVEFCLVCKMKKNIWLRVTSSVTFAVRCSFIRSK